MPVMTRQVMFQAGDSTTMTHAQHITLSVCLHLAAWCACGACRAEEGTAGLQVLTLPPALLVEPPR